MDPIYEINRLADQLPLPVVQDLHQRIADWLSSFGAYDNPYMLRQLWYAKVVAKEENQMVSTRNEPTVLKLDDIEIKWTWEESELLHFRAMCLLMN